MFLLPWLLSHHQRHASTTKSTMRSSTTPLAWLTAYASTALAIGPRVVQMLCHNVSDHTGSWQVPAVNYGYMPAPVYLEFGPTTIIAGDLRTNFRLPDRDRASSRPQAPGGLDVDIFEYMTLPANLSNNYDEDATITAPITLANNWTRQVWNGQNYTVMIGQLGLNPSDNSPSMAERFMKAGYIDSPSYSMHLGNSQVGPSGRVTLGGYEQNRVGGDVGVFTHKPGSNAPMINLVDMMLGVEVGGSPFDPKLNISKDHPFSVWVDGNAASASAAFGSIPVNVTGTWPSLLLPAANCEAVAAHLPVSWNEHFGYYIWDTASSLYGQLMSSPAYLGLVLEDALGKKVTIKLPFRLLNQTFTPFANQSLVYFPCQRQSNSKMVTLGRAFLQGAFYATNYATNLTYIGQGLGPVIDQSTIRAFPNDETTPLASSPVSFASSWSKFWTPLPEDPVPSKYDSYSGISDSQRFSTGKIAGIVVGVIVAITAMVVATSCIGRCWRKPAKQVENTIEEADSVSTEAKKNEMYAEIDAQDAAKHELPGPEAVQEIAGRQVAELEA